MVLLSWFIQEGRSSVDSRGVRNVALARHTSIVLRYVLGSFDFGVSLYTTRRSARPESSPFLPKQLTIDFLSEIATYGMHCSTAKVSRDVQHRFDNAVKTFSSVAALPRHPAA